MDLSVINYEYLAGLIDADGSITIVNRNDNKNKGRKQGFRIKVCIYNCNITIIKLLTNFLGGKFRSNNINKSHSKWRNCFEFSLYDKKAIDLIQKLYPFLIVKKAQANIVLEFNKIKSKYNPTFKRWHPELQDECIKNLLKLKNDINKLNIRGAQKIFMNMDITNIPFSINYLAGFCDADGSIMICKIGRGQTARITFTNTDKNVINWIRFHKGGNEEKRMPANNNWNISYSLRFGALKAYKLASELYHSLIIKKEQAKLVMALGKSKKSNNKSKSIQYNNELKIKCSNLNKRSI